jgi:hypothetical protein
MEFVNVANINGKSGGAGFPTTLTLDRTACAAFVKESRMEFVNVAKFNGKSGEPFPQAGPCFVLLILELKAFEKRHVFGPRTLMRTWGTPSTSGGVFVDYLRWIVMPVEMRNRFWSLAAVLGRRV